MKPRPVKPKEENQIDVLIEIFVALLTDYFWIGVNEKDLEYLKRRSKAEGLYFITRTLPTISDKLLAYLENGDALVVQSFGKCKHGYPKFLSGLFRLVCNPNHTNHVSAVKAIYQIGNLATKLRGEYDREVLTNQLNDFIRTDTDLPNISGDSILHYARYLVTKVFKDFDPMDIIPRPGPGAVKTPMKLIDRFRPHVIFSDLDDFYHTAEYAYATWYESRKNSSTIINLLKNKRETACARLCFVPKKVQKAREICIEENEMQRIQQGLGRKIMRLLETSPIVSGEINFARQDFNAMSALLSSKSGSLATLDMSAASNRVSLELVRYLFSRNPFVLEALEAATSKFIDMDSCIPHPTKQNEYLKFGLLEKKMFAPMGSALCFPIMSLVHWALIRSVQVHTNTDRSRGRIFVYGDDLIVPTHLVEPLLDIMPRYGMKFNNSKSYWRGKFRESCGIHAYNGVDITPVYIKYTPESDICAEKMKSVIENEHQLWKNGLHNVSNLYRRRYKIPFVNPKSSVIGWKRPDAPFVPNGTIRRYSDELQRWQYRHKTLASINEDESLVKMPPAFRITVLTESQMKQYKERRLWDEDEAYLRSLTVQANDHTWFRDTNLVIFKYRWL